MRDALFGSLQLVGVGGYAIMAAIVVLVVVAVVVNARVRARYAAMIQDLQRNGQVPPAFQTPTLNRIVREVEAVAAQHAGAINTQAIIEHNIQADLGPLLVGERFVKATTGLTIVFGLLGTFTGLTVSIGKLAVLVSGSAPGVSDITASLTGGLRQALSGMSVAFATSLFGIASAIVMTLVGVFLSVTDRRTAFMVRVEAYLDNVLLSARHAAQVGDGRGRAGAAGVGAAGAPVTAALEPVLARFGQSVAALEAAVGRFDGSLRGFSATTREFHEFNMHLKDNIQRMSLAFGDLSETLKREVGALRGRDRS
jgi:hypothetical protein